MNILEAINVAKPFSKCPHERLRVFAKALVDLDVKRVEGDVVVCGVWRGGLGILARLLSQRRMWLYDTFNGMANPSEFDTKRNGYQMLEGKAAVSADEVLENLKMTGTAVDVVFVTGKVEDTLHHEVNLPEKIAALYLDTDWYHSTKIELEVLWPRLQKNGAMIVDDYGHWRGARKAVEDYFPPLQRNMMAIDKTAIMMIK